MYSCDQCDHKATITSNLNIHIKSKHKGIQFSCDQCHFISAYKSTLRRHTETIHKGIKYPCDQCDHISKAKGMIHKKFFHEGIRYPCNVCNHQSRSVMNLRDHQASKHKINPRFRCKLCDLCTNHTRVKREHVLKRHPESMGQEIFEINNNYNL